MDDASSSNARVQQFWNEYATAARLGGPVGFTVFAFGDSENLADELVALVINGAKRATASLPRDFEAMGEPLPRPGDLSVIIDGRKVPRCIIRVVRVEIKPMREVDARFAWDEGEGDRSLAWWTSAHMRYFERQGAREGFEFDVSAEVVLERFEVVWPPEVADQTVAEFVQTVANESRLKILGLLAVRDQKIGELARALGERGNNVAHHVSLLVESGLVEEVRNHDQLLLRLKMHWLRARSRVVEPRR